MAVQKVKKSFAAARRAETVTEGGGGAGQSRGRESRSIQEKEKPFNSREKDRSIQKKKSFNLKKKKNVLFKKNICHKTIENINIKT